MGLYVVDAACTFVGDHSSGIIVIESDITNEFPMAIEELQGTESRNLAIKHAAKQGVSDPRINGTPPGTYAINAEGLSLEAVKGDQGEVLPPQHPRMQVARYRIDVPITRRLI